MSHTPMCVRVSKYVNTGVGASSNLSNSEKCTFTKDKHHFRKCFCWLYTTQAYTYVNTYTAHSYIHTVERHVCKKSHVYKQMSAPRKMKIRKMHSTVTSTPNRMLTTV